MNLIALAVLAVLGWRLRRSPSRPASEPASALSSRWIVGVVALVTAAVMWWCWDNPMATVHDELAYLLQAQIFARGRWSLPSPVVPEFFEQAYMLVVPVLASKYPPGFSLVLALGVMVGAPMLVPLVLHAGSASLLFVLARRLTNGGIALLTWVLWLSSPSVLLFGPRYFSETVTTACWLGSFLCLLNWRDTGRRRWLLGLAFLVGWGAITRPLTMLLFAIPIGVVVVELVRRRRAWRDLALAFAVGVAVLAIIPLWSARTTGSWRVSPLTLYIRQYTPWDVPGFGFNQRPPERELTPDLEKLRKVLGIVHAEHTVTALPSIAAMRMRAIRSGIWGGPRELLIPFAVLGLATVGMEMGVALAAAVMLILGYLSFAMYASWTLYYYESFPIFAFLTASGLGLALAALARRDDTALHTIGWRAPRLANLAATGALLFLPAAGMVVRVARHLQHIQHVARQVFNDRVATIGAPRAVVFVRYAATHDPHVSFVRNSADPERERVWVAYDRGPADNVRLLAHVPDRVPYLFDEATGTMRPYAESYATP